MNSIDLQTAEAAYRQRSADSFLVFVRGLVIPSAVGPVLFDDVMQPFQRETFAALAPSLQAVRDGDVPPVRRFWIERTKKAGKDSDLAACLLWLVAFPRRPFLIQVSASDRDQAGILKRRIDDLLYYNEWLGGLVRSVQNRVTSLAPGLDGDRVLLNIEATESAGGTHGATPDVLVLNELVHVARWSVMEAHMANADGVPRGLAIVSTNAGVRGTRAELWRNNALADRKRWSVHIMSGVAPWLSKEDVEEAKKRDPVGMEYQRLWLGQWVSGKGGAVDEASIDRCFCLPGPSEPEPGWSYVAGLDLGISHDHSGVVVLGVNWQQQRLKVAYFGAWEPAVPNDRGVLEVDLAAVEEACFRLWQKYRVEWFGYDPAAGGSFMAQRLRRRGVPMCEVSFASPAALTEMAKAFVTAVKEGKLECYDDAAGRLRRDFGKFAIEHRPPSHYRLTAVSDEYGHADVGTALVICLPRALERLAKGGSRFLSDDELVYEPGEVKKEELPPELREIYEAEDRWQEERRVLRAAERWDRTAELY